MPEINTQYIHTESLVINNHLTNKIKTFRNPGYSLTNFCALLNIKLRFKIKKISEDFFEKFKQVRFRKKNFKNLNSGISRRMLRMFFRLIRRKLDFKQELALKMLRMNRIKPVRRFSPYSDNYSPGVISSRKYSGKSPSHQIRQINYYNSK
jgi:hypothetical protein